MKILRYITILLIATGPLLLLTSCEEKEDYSHITYKNYLTYEINRATNFLNTTVEGSKEGEYQPGSKQSYQLVIDNARQVDQTESPSQQEIDAAYASLLKAAGDFSDKMVPFRSDFQEWIDYSDLIHAHTQEGEQEGDVKYGSKAIFQDEIDDAKYTIAREDLTQRLLDQATTDLTEAIYTFNAEINGRWLTVVKNPGFELPGYETDDFGLVEGWSLFKKAETWAPKASISALETVPEGQYAAKIGSYTQGIYQRVFELIHPGSEYILNFKVSLLSNNPDWQGKKYPAILLSRLIVFDQGEGDYNFITLLHESYDTLGIIPGGFLEMSVSVNIDAISPSIGKRIAIDFIQRHTWDAENPIWAESFVAIDDVRLYRKLK